MKRRILSLILATVLLYGALTFTMNAVPVFAEPAGENEPGGETVYTVTLYAGEGFGGPLVFSCSDPVHTPPPYDTSDYCFCHNYTDYTGECVKVGFRLPNSCPYQFMGKGNAPFTGWDGFSGGIYWFGQDETDVSFTATWAPPALTAYGPIAGIPRYDGGLLWFGGNSWKVIGKGDTSWLLISAEVIGQNYTVVDADESCLSLYNALSDIEKNAIVPTTKSEGKYDINMYYGYEHGSMYSGFYEASYLNKSKLFLLSAAEATWYLDGNSGKMPGGWWLRSKVTNEYLRAAVGTSGALENAKYSKKGFGVRPAFRLEASSFLFTSAAEGGKSTAAAGSGSFGFLRAVPWNAKPTLIDSDRAGFSASVSKTDVIPGETIAVDYGGVASGDCVSAILCNASGEVVYHASKTANASGTWELTLPQNLSPGGWTLKIFSEQQNEDCVPDRCSPAVSVTLEVSSFTVDFVNYDGTVLQTVYHTPGQMPEYDGETPEKPSEDLRVGYVFDGWDPAISPVTSDTTYTAQFREEAKYVVTFDANGGSGSMPADSYFAYTGKYTIPDCGFTAPDGYAFKHWIILKEDANGVVSTTTRVARSTMTGLTGDITIMPEWQEIRVELFAAPNGGGTVSFDPSSATFTAVAAEGYTFNHWEYAKDEFSMAPDGTVWPTANPYTPEELLSGVYTAVFRISQYTVSVYANHDEWGSVTGSGTYNYNKKVTLTATPAEGYRFLEWAVTPSETVIGADNKLTVPANDVTVTAIFVSVFDLNCTEDVDITDVTFLLNVLAGSLENAPGYDLNHDEDINVGDVTALLNFLAEN